MKYYLGIVLLWLILISLPLQAKSNIESGLALAERAAAWIDSHKIKTKNGITWPSVPGKKRPVYDDLYSGPPGVILFYIQLYRSTGKQQYLMIAKAGADQLLSILPAIKPQKTYYGFYVGIGGTAFILDELYKLSKENKYRIGVERCLSLIEKGATRAGSGVEWYGYTDIIMGAAGTGLLLLHLNKRYLASHPALIKSVTAAADRLIEIAMPAHGGLKWGMDPKTSYTMPNFSHGTAGIAYFLLCVYERTDEKRFFDAARKGAKYLARVADTGKGCFIFHSDKDEEGKKRHYLGWCHGPVGTGRLFYKLFRITGEKRWKKMMIDGMRGVMDSGIPERKTPGFWNNVGRCCGSAGIAEYSLDLFRVTGDNKYLKFSERLTSEILMKAVPGPAGKKWIHAEHRKKPDLLEAKTGLMQGAAGIGLWLLKRHDFRMKKKNVIRFPDTPFNN